MNDHLDEKRARYEDMLLAILQSEEKIEPFIDTIFSFLHRRTDFFLVQETESQPYGFPKGVAKQIVTKLFQKYDDLPKETMKQRLLETNSEISKKLATSHASAAASKEPDLKNTQGESSKTPKTTDSFQVPGADALPLEKQQEAFQSNPLSYNGAIRDNYSWTQSIKDIDVHVKVVPSLKTSKQVKIKFEKQSLQVSLVDPDSKSWKTVIDDKLPWKIRPEQSTWSLFPGEHIHICLEKAEERWWENLLVSESKLDLKFMNPEKPMEDLDEEAQAKIKQMMYDEQQKRLGLPTSEEQRQQEILRKAWDLEGSPFKGQPFDPSVLKNL